MINKILQGITVLLIQGAPLPSPLEKLCLNLDAAADPMATSSSSVFTPSLTTNFPFPPTTTVPSGFGAAGKTFVTVARFSARTMS